MDREVLVYVDLDGAPYLVGRLWTRPTSKRQLADKARFTPLAREHVRSPAQRD
jgi:hypothetical protein